MITVSVPQHALSEDAKPSHSCTTILVFNGSERLRPRSPVGALAFLTCNYEPVETSGAVVDSRVTVSGRIAYWLWIT